MLMQVSLLMLETLSKARYRLQTWDRHARAWPWERFLKGEESGSCCRMLSCLKSSRDAPVDSRTMPVMTSTSGVHGSANRKCL